MKPALFTRLLAAAALATVSLHSHAFVAVSPYTEVYAFGDSLTDGGNVYLFSGGVTGPDPINNSFIPSAAYSPSGTFSDGPTWFTPFAAGLGLPAFAAPSLAGGGNHAWGGARMATDGAGLPPSVGTQLGMFLGGGGSFSPGSLVVLAGGGNDVRDTGDAVAVDPGNAAALIGAAASAYATAAASMVQTLQTAGAAHIVVWNVPDVGKAPAVTAEGALVAGTASFIAGTFNAALSNALAGSGVMFFDTFGLINEVVSDPAAFGFTNAQDACGAGLCNPATGLFWDGIHPTAAAQQLIANRMLAVAAIPEPETALLFAFGLAGLLAWSRRRAA